MVEKLKVLITGGSGYIGAHAAVEVHNAGFVPVLVDNFSKSDRTLLDGFEKITGAKAIFIEGDCTDARFLNQIFEQNGPFQAVMHFAAFKSVGESVQFPLMYYRNNLDSLISLLDVMSKFKVKDLIFSSSCTVYGQPDAIPVSENAPFTRAESPYGATKQMCERILEDAFKTGYRIISLRYFNPIGAHPSALMGELPIGAPNNLVPYITQTAAGVRPVLTVFGQDYNTPDGSCIRDYIHVVDLAKAHVIAMNFLKQRQESTLLEIFNLGTGAGVSVLQLVKEFTEATGVKVPYVIGARRPGDVEKVYADPSKANSVLGWKPEFTNSEALLHAWNWEKRIRNIR